MKDGLEPKIPPRYHVGDVGRSEAIKNGGWGSGVKEWETEKEGL